MEQQDLLLMMKDEIIMKINIEDGKYEIVNERLLPILLKNRFRIVPDGITDLTYLRKQISISVATNYDAFTSWLSNRVLPLSRDNAKKVYSLLHLEQNQSVYNKAKIALLCRAISLQDNYWIKLESELVQWDDINLRTNHLNKVVAQVSLRGSSLSLTGKLTTPELTGQGAYAKAWFRVGDKLWLYKKGSVGDSESRIEVMVSNLLDNCNVEHLKYEPSMIFDVFCCRCQCMTTDNISIMPAMDFNSYCNRLGLNFEQECLKIDAESIYKMWIVDYLIANRDRHGMNWGFFFNCDTNEILSCHPLYDHNNAFDIEFMLDEDADYQAVSGKSIKQAAIYAIKKVDFHFYRDFVREDFITERQYKTFMKRARQLGIKVK